MEKIWLKNYQEGVPAEIDVHQFDSLVAMFHDSCEQFSDRPALSNFGTCITYQAFAKHSHALAAYFQHVLGLQKGDRIALMMPNLLQYPIAFFAALEAGLVVVNVNPLYTPHELTHQLNDAGAKAIIVMSNYAHVVQTALPAVKLEHIIVTKMGDLLSFPKNYLANFIVKHVKKMEPDWAIPNTIAFCDALVQGKQHKLAPLKLSNNDVALLQYTGGTTGISKGAVLTHGNLNANIEQVLQWFAPMDGDYEKVVITALPLYHIFALTANLLTFVRFGAHNVLVTNPRDMKGFIKILINTPFNVIMGVNTLFNGLLHHPDFAKIDTSHLRLALGGGMAVQRAVAEKWQELTGKPLIEGYGLTEASPVVSVNPLNLAEYNASIGLPVPSTDIAIRDEAGNDVAIGESGELCVRGPQVMQGYWQRPDETAKVIDADGWLHTGDIATMDEQGYLRIVDRKKDMIVVSGFNVFPNEVEDVIAMHAGVREVAVVGVKSESSGEKVKAFVVRDDASLSDKALIAFCRTELTAYKVPKDIEFVDELPKSNVGKILRRELRDGHD